MSGNLERKAVFLKKIQDLLETYSKIILVQCDNVGSNQMQKIRKALRGKAVVLMGKNTIVRKAMRATLSKSPGLEPLMNYVAGNVGLVFSNDDLSEVRQIIVDNKVGAPAKAGAVAPVDVIVPAGPTGMEPTMTSFLQALNISSKINKGQVEIVSDVHLLKKGEKVGGSEASLLEKLKIYPFSYGLIPETVYDNGEIFGAFILELTDNDIIGKVQIGIDRLTCVSLATGIPTACSVPHIIINGYKNVLGIALGTEYVFEKAKALKELLDNPEAMAAAAAAAAKSSTPSGGGGGGEAKKEEVVEEEEEEGDMGFGLFD